MSFPHDSSSRIYNSKIFQLLIEYTERQYPHVDINLACARSGLSMADMFDSSTWLTQEQGEKFCETLCDDYIKKPIAMKDIRQITKKYTKTGRG